MKNIWRVIGLVFFFAPILAQAAMSEAEKERELQDFLQAGERYQILLNIRDQKLAQSICHQVVETFAKQATAKCYFNQRPAEANRFNKYQLQFVQVDQTRIDAKFVLNQPQYDDVDQVLWTLNRPSNAKQLSEFKKVVKRIAQNALEYDQYAAQMKDLLFYHGLLLSKRIQPAGDMFQIVENGRVTQTVNKEIAKREFMRESLEKRNYLRGALEVAAFLGVGKGLYILGHDSMKEDWDFNNKTVSDFKNRIFSTDQMKFDDNAVSMNWGHAYAGVLYYSAARNNGFSSYESLLVTLASSSIWEYFGEYKEVVSINDQIITGIGGAIIGETLYQISNMLKEKDSMIAKTLGAIINPVGTLNDVLDGKGAFHAHQNFTRKLGFNSDGYSHIDILAGLKMAANRDSAKNTYMAEMGFDSSVINLPVSGAGKVNTLVLDPSMAELFALGSISDEGIEDWQMITKLALGGYFAKDLTTDEAGNLKGHSFFIAPAVRTEYTSHGNGHSKDFYAMVNVIGTTMDITYYFNGGRLRFALDVYGDFAMVRPYGLEELKNSGHNMEGTKSVLSKRGYYFAAGATGIAAIKYQKGVHEVGTSYTQHYFDSIDDQNLNRHIDRVTDDVSMKDRLQSVKIYYTRSISEKYKISLGLERIFREGKINQVKDGAGLINKKDIEDRIWLQLQMPLS